MPFIIIIIILTYLPMEEFDSCPHLAPLLGRGGGGGTKMNEYIRLLEPPFRTWDL